MPRHVITFHMGVSLLLAHITKQKNSNDKKHQVFRILLSKHEVWAFFERLDLNRLEKLVPRERYKLKDPHEDQYRETFVQKTRLLTKSRARARKLQ